MAANEAVQSNAPVLFGPESCWVGPWVESVSNRAAIIGSSQATSLTSLLRCEPPWVQRIRASAVVAPIDGRYLFPRCIWTEKWAEEKSAQRPWRQWNVEQSAGRKSIGPTLDTFIGSWMREQSVTICLPVRHFGASNERLSHADSCRWLMEPASPPEWLGRNGIAGRRN